MGDSLSLSPSLLLSTKLLGPDGGIALLLLSITSPRDQSDLSWKNTCVCVTPIPLSPRKPPPLGSVGWSICLFCSVRRVKRVFHDEKNRHKQGKSGEVWQPPSPSPLSLVRITHDCSGAPGSRHHRKENAPIGTCYGNLGLFLILILI